MSPALLEYCKAEASSSDVYGKQNSNNRSKICCEKNRQQSFGKMSDTYDNTKRKVLQNTFGAKPLNVGEREFVDCLRTTGNRSQCERVAQKAVKQYRKTGKY